MLSWFQALMPRAERFFVQFERHEETLVSGSHALIRRVPGPPSAGIALPDIVDDFVIFAALTGAIVAA